MIYAILSYRLSGKKISDYSNSLELKTVLHEKK